MLSVDNLYSDGTETLTYGAAQNSQMLWLRAFLEHTPTVRVFLYPLRLSKYVKYTATMTYQASFVHSNGANLNWGALKLETCTLLNMYNFEIGGWGEGHLYPPLFLHLCITKLAQVFSLVLHEVAPFFYVLTNPTFAT